MLKKATLLTSVVAGEMILRRQQQQLGLFASDNDKKKNDKKSCSGDDADTDENAPSCESDEDKKKREKRLKDKQGPIAKPKSDPVPNAGGETIAGGAPGENGSASSGGESKPELSPGLEGISLLVLSI